MYTDYFGLHDEPFRVTPDSRFFFPGIHHRVAQELLHWIRTGSGVATLAGSAGTGKTVVLRWLNEQLMREGHPVVLVGNANLSFDDFLALVSSALGLQVEEDTEAKLRAIENYVRYHITQGRRPVLLIDEAGRLNPEVAHQLPLLLGGNTATLAQFVTVLAGDEEGLRRWDGSALSSQLSFQGRLELLTVEEVVGYVNHRLRVAGAQRDDLFEPAALERIATLSQGIPRLINNLSSKALLEAFLNERSAVNAELVELVGSELELAGRGGHKRQEPSSLPERWETAVLRAQAGVGGFARKQQPAVSGNGQGKRVAAAPPSQPPQFVSVERFLPPEDEASGEVHWQPPLQPERHEREPAAIEATRPVSDPKQDTRQLIVGARRRLGIVLLFLILIVGGLLFSGSSLREREGGVPQWYATIQERGAAVWGEARGRVLAWSASARDWVDGVTSGLNSDERAVDKEQQAEATGANTSSPEAVDAGLPDQNEENRALVADQPWSMEEPRNGSMASTLSSSSKRQAGSKEESTRALGEIPNKQEIPASLLENNTAEFSVEQSRYTPKIVEIEAELGEIPLILPTNLEKTQNKGDATLSSAFDPGSGEKSRPGASSSGPAMVPELARRIETLLDLARRQEELRQFTIPRGDSAFETYTEILNLAPEHPEALAGIESMRDRYVSWARAAGRRDEWDKAIQYYRRALRVDPQNGAVREALDRVERWRALQIISE